MCSRVTAPRFILQQSFFSLDLSSSTLIDVPVTIRGNCCATSTFACNSFSFYSSREFCSFRSVISSSFWAWRSAFSFNYASTFSCNSFSWFSSRDLCFSRFANFLSISARVASWRWMMSVFSSCKLLIFVFASVSAFSAFSS